MKLFPTATLLFLALPLTAGAVTQEEAIRKVSELSRSVDGFRAKLEITEKGGGIDCVSTSALTVSKTHGFKTDIFREGVQCQIISDFSTAYQYFPEGKQAMKMTALSSEVRDLFRQPATHMNPLQLLDPKTLKFHGEENLKGHPVYHFEGTTTTQFIPEGQPVTSSMEAWISAKDGLPRKTIEKVGPNAVTTVYTDLEVNPPLQAEDFRFTPGPDVQVIDADRQMRQEQRRQPIRTPATGPGAKKN